MESQRIQALSCWESIVRVEPLAGGITNRNYVVYDRANRYVVRFCADRSLLGIDRRNELACQRAAAEFGISPSVVHAEPPFVVSQWVSGQTLSAEDVRDEARLLRIAHTLRQLHATWDRLRGELLYFSPFQTVRSYLNTARNLRASVPADMDDLLADATELERRIEPFRPVLCHNDLLAANLIEDDQRMWLVDWEYAGMGHPLFDLAGLSGNCGLDEAQERFLLEAYLGTPPQRRTVVELQILKTISLLRESLWAVIQTVASEIEFDYTTYARDNLTAYRAARQCLQE